MPYDLFPTDVAMGSVPKDNDDASLDSQKLRNNCLYYQYQDRREISSDLEDYDDPLEKMDWEKDIRPPISLPPPPNTAVVRGNVRVPNARITLDTRSSTYWPKVNAYEGHPSQAKPVLPSGNLIPGLASHDKHNYRDPVRKSPAWARDTPDQKRQRVLEDLAWREQLEYHMNRPDHPEDLDNLVYASKSGGLWDYRDQVYAAELEGEKYDQEHARDQARRSLAPSVSTRRAQEATIGSVDWEWDRKGLGGARAYMKDMEIFPTTATNPRGMDSLPEAVEDAHFRSKFSYLTRMIEEYVVGYQYPLHDEELANFNLKRFCMDYPALAKGINRVVDGRDGYSQFLIQPLERGALVYALVFSVLQARVFADPSFGASQAQIRAINMIPEALNGSESPFQHKKHLSNVCRQHDRPGQMSHNFINNAKALTNECHRLLHPLRHLSLIFTDTEFSELHEVQAYDHLHALILYAAKISTDMACTPSVFTFSHPPIFTPDPMLFASAKALETIANAEEVSLSHSQARARFSVLRASPKNWKHDRAGPDRPYIDIICSQRLTISRKSPVTGSITSTPVFPALVGIRRNGGEHFDRQDLAPVSITQAADAEQDRLESLRRSHSRSRSSTSRSSRPLSRPNSRQGIRWFRGGRRAPYMSLREKRTIFAMAPPSQFRLFLDDIDVWVWERYFAVYDFFAVGNGWRYVFGALLLAFCLATVVGPETSLSYQAPVERQEPDGLKQAVIDPVEDLREKVIEGVGEERVEDVVERMGITPAESLRTTWPEGQVEMGSFVVGATGMVSTVHECPEEVGEAVVTATTEDSGEFTTDGVASSAVVETARVVWETEGTKDSVVEEVVEEGEAVSSNDTTVEKKEEKVEEGEAIGGNDTAVEEVVGEDLGDGGDDSSKERVVEKADGDTTQGEVLTKMGSLIWLVMQRVYRRHL